MKITNELGPLQLVEEGKARIYVPLLEAYRDEKGHIDPARAPVFYNPRMIASRDLAVAAIEAYVRGRRLSQIKLAEPFCSTGVRGIRYAIEVDEVLKVVMGDISKKAITLTKINVKLNNINAKTEVLHCEANMLLSIHAKRSERFDVIDIDPFGSPAPFIYNALRALKNEGLLAVTATDLPPLFGIYPLACRRKYLSIPLRTDYAPEVGLRILLGFIAREAAKLEAGIIILLAYYMDHYLRVYTLIRKGAKEADKALDQLGYILHCNKCGWRGVQSGLIPDTIESCPICATKLRKSGPLWLGSLGDVGFLTRLRQEIINRDYLRERKRLLKLVDKILQEVSIRTPFYYTVSELAKYLGINEVKPRMLVERLRSNGYKASLTHFNPKGVKTEVDITLLLELLK